MLTLVACSALLLIATARAGAAHLHAALGASGVAVWPWSVLSLAAAVGVALSIVP